MDEPFNPGDVEDYLEKASLSPWVPLPESACRKYFDFAEVEPGDVHVDLGSGDGRVNFYAYDYAGVEKSTGIDIDTTILKVAQDRLAKRHPQPKNLEFIEADLLDENNPVWEKVQEANIITMFFVEEALAKFRPLLERKLIGKKCRILTAGYAMPTWNPYLFEVVRGTTIYLYKWGYDDDEEMDFPFFDENILQSRPESLDNNPLENDQFKDYTIIDHTLEPKTREELMEEDRAYWEEEDDLENDTADSSDKQLEEESNGGPSSDENDDEELEADILLSALSADEFEQHRRDAGGAQGAQRYTPPSKSIE
eukprot:CAMPEP_0198145980 /NCGR_PEP_ID=MMETSP1443-20131203/26651_1 /TAXON_ID=186043 /ORGANISM="Entomoneis sp., Strain CCMP2396" /LENGTH=309 /DNA_ID=CAMNT_0043809767 /DNA_START=331 /DNA_END=1260 /DNA_ORIENTATION=+